MNLITLVNLLIQKNQIIKNILQMINNLIFYITMIQNILQYQMACSHFKYIPNQPIFLSPLLNKVHWINLYDGSIRIKKQISLQQLCKTTQKLNEQYKLMINCETLEIYCTGCQKQIYDILPQTQENQPKDKKIIKNPFNYRQKLVKRPQTEDLFAGNIQYPESFQKDKRGLCGLKENAINSYINSTIQLIAAIPIFQDISSMISFEKVDCKILREFFQTIDAIWSGKYRVYKASQIQKYLISQDSNFRSYRYKNPQQFFYFILKKIEKQFGFHEVSCEKGIITSQIFQEWKQTDGYRYYSLFRQIFGGVCTFQKVCEHCHHKERMDNNFEWLKVNYQKTKYYDSSLQIQIEKLIDQSFNWKLKYEQMITHIQKGKVQCIRCSQDIKNYNAYVSLPNHLIIQFGQTQQGLNVSLPDQIDLTKHSEQLIKDKKDELVVYDYIGSIFRKDKQYVAHILHNKKQYDMLNESIIQSKRMNQSTKIALYKRRIGHKNTALFKNIASCLEVNVNPVVPLPDFWSLYLKHHYSVPPLMNPFISPYGKLKNNHILSKNKQGIQKIPIQIYSYLLQMYGGRKIQIKDEKDFCKKHQEILSKILDIKNSQRQMANFADKLSNKKDFVLIDRTWLGQWRKYIYQDERKGYRNFVHKRPCAIKNNPSQQQKMKKISPQVWYFLQKFYGGGPLVTKNTYKPNLVLKTSVNLRYQSVKEIIKQIYDVSAQTKLKDNIDPLQLQQISQIDEDS